MKEIRCIHCGSDDVYRTIVSYWTDFEGGRWVDDVYSEELHCHECGGNEMDIREVMVDAK